MKNVLVAFLQFLLFIVVFAAFSFVPPFHIEHVLGTTSDGTRVFIADGLVITTLLFIAILAIEAARKRLRRSGMLTTAAFAAAVLIGLAIKLGFKTNSPF